MRKLDYSEFTFNVARRIRMSQRIEIYFNEITAKESSPFSSMKCVTILTTELLFTFPYELWLIIKRMDLSTIPSILFSFDRSLMSQQLPSS